MPFFLYWKQRLKYLLKHVEDIGGVRMWVQRDNVTGHTFYQHTKDPNHLAIRGIYPYISRGDNDPSRYYLLIETRGGDIEKDIYQNRVMLNAQGITATWEKHITCFRVGSRYRTHVTVPANSEWLTSLRALATAEMAVVRFSKITPNHDSHFDFKVKEWNRRLVCDVLRVYDFLVEQATNSTQSSEVIHESLPSPSDVVHCGPFVLKPDGSISDVNTRLNLPPGIEVGRLVIEGHTLESHPLEGYVITDHLSVQRRAVYRDGRWLVKTLST